MLRRAVVLLFVSALAGALVGLYAPGGIKALTTQFILRAHPGATAYLNCGWHEGDCPLNPSTGHALDWQNADAATVYWRSYGWCSSTPCTVIAIGTIGEPAGGCQDVTVEVRSTRPPGVYQGTIRYVHTDTSSAGTSFNINGGTSYT